MTPSEYISRIDALVADRQYDAVAALVREHHARLLPQLTDAQFAAVASVMEVVDRIVDPHGPPPRLGTDDTVAHGHLGQRSASQPPSGPA